jgi:hypothetical protein
MTDGILLIPAEPVTGPAGPGPQLTGSLSWQPRPGPDLNEPGRPPGGRGPHQASNLQESWYCRPSVPPVRTVKSTQGISNNPCFLRMNFFPPLYFNRRNVRGVWCNVGGEIVGPYPRICDKNFLQQYVD